MQFVAGETMVIDGLQVPLETSAYGPPLVSLRKTMYPPFEGNPDAALQFKERLVVVGVVALPVPGELSATALACPDPFAEVVQQA